MPTTREVPSLHVHAENNVSRIQFACTDMKQYHWFKVKHTSYSYPKNNYPYRQCHSHSQTCRALVIRNLKVFACSNSTARSPLCTQVWVRTLNGKQEECQTSRQTVLAHRMLIHRGDLDGTSVASMLLNTSKADGDGIEGYRQSCSCCFSRTRTWA